MQKTELRGVSLYAVEFGLYFLNHYITEIIIAPVESISEITSALLIFSLKITPEFINTTTHPNAALSIE